MLLLVVVKLRRAVVVEQFLVIFHHFRLFRWGQWFFGSVGFFPLRFQEIQKFEEFLTVSA